MLGLEFQILGADEAGSRGPILEPQTDLDGADSRGVD